MKRKGFTLIELLTVIAIIGILASLLIVGLGKIQASARSSTSTANLRQIYSVMQLYVNDKKGKFPPAQTAKGKIWIDVIAPYADALTDGDTSPTREKPPSEIFRCPVAASDDEELARIKAGWGYGYNYQQGDKGDNIATANTYHRYTIGDVTFLPFRVLVADAYNWNLASPADRAYERHDGIQANILYFDGNVDKGDKRTYELGISDPQTLKNR